MSSYKNLTNHFSKILKIHNAMSILGWDFQTMLPKNSVSSRSEELATLTGIIQDLTKDERISSWISEAKNDNSLSDADKANLDLTEKYWRLNAKLPNELVQDLQKQEMKTESIWVEAREQNDFKKILPELKTLFELVKNTAEEKAKIYECSPYDAMLKTFDQDMNQDLIDPIFSDLKAFLPDFLSEVLEKQKKDPAKKINGHFPIEKQKELSRYFMKALGFDFEKGRLDVSVHPFCGGTPDDVRITTRYDESDFTSALMGVLHETGHALYEMGLPKSNRYQLVGEARGIAMHESQSLFIEMQVSRSQEFIDFALPHIKSILSSDGPEWTSENIFKLYTHVEPGFIRVDADEVTYPAHVIIRYELEKALVSGDLQLEDLPTAWNDKYKEMLGIVPPTDAVGCLQDIHWFGGAIGYFPCYTFGALIAAQLAETAKADVINWSKSIKSGDFKPVVSWLQENVHTKGSQYSMKDILLSATGKSLSTQPLKDHLKKRYLG